MDENFGIDGCPVTTDIPMLRDETTYTVYIILKEKKYNNIEIKAVAKVCNINYLEARNKLINRKTLIAQGNAYEIRDILGILSQYDVNLEIVPAYPYKLNSDCF